MKKIIPVTLILFAATLTNCNSETKKEETKKEKTEKSEEVKADTVETPKKVKKPAEIVLNDGAKWKVNEEMIPFITSGEKMVTEFLVESKTDYKKLATDLEGQNQKLISSCTMNGKSHDELHKWLMPHLGLVARLKKAESAEDAKPLVQKLDSSYLKYNSYFE